MFRGIADLHVHSAPSLWPRRRQDGETMLAARQAGVEWIALKAHEGSTVERARLVGEGAVGGIVLNAPVGGANPDAVQVAAALGGRIVWMPTISAIAHQSASNREELNVHQEIVFHPVPVIENHRLLPEWRSVFELIATHDLVLASGHLSMDETALVFTAAAALGVRRLLVNHPMLPFLGWREEHLDIFQQLGAYIEIGVLGDLLSGSRFSSSYFLARYPHSLLVFGSDLGHTRFPDYAEGVQGWVRQLLPVAGEPALEQVLTINGKKLVLR